MLLIEYFSDLVKIINDYSKTNLIIGTDLTTDFRTEKIGLIRGRILFIDDSRLHFTEYLDLRFKIEKLSYSYHYQDRAGKMILRYDNAVHKPGLGYSDHKHLISGQIIPSITPMMDGILREIMSHIL